MTGKSHEFGVISSIDVEVPSTWENRTFLTFDVDWAHDDVIADTINLVERVDVAATWFITHDTKLIGRLRENPKFEIGLHPNFNELLTGNVTKGESAISIFQRLKKIAPFATAVRSHSLVQSERLVDIFHENGCSHISNFFIPEDTIDKLAPWKLWDNITAIPHCWQDNVSMRTNENIQPPRKQSANTIRVVDFHPIHIFVNSEKMQHYERVRPWFQVPEELIAYRNHDIIGTRDILKGLIGTG